MIRGSAFSVTSNSVTSKVVETYFEELLIMKKVANGNLSTILFNAMRTVGIEEDGSLSDSSNSLVEMLLEAYQSATHGNGSRLAGDIQGLQEAYSRLGVLLGQLAAASQQHSANLSEETRLYLEKVAEIAGGSPKLKKAAAEIRALINAKSK